MLPLGLAMGLSVCVGQAAGRRDYAGAARAGYTGIALCSGLASLSCLGTLWWAEHIAALYSDDAAVATLAVPLFHIAAWLQLGDGVQAAATFALRGLKDTRVPMFITVLAYWGLGLPLGYWLGIVRGQGAPGLWTGLILGLSVAASLLGWRFWRLARRPLTPVGPLT